MSRTRAPRMLNHGIDSWDIRASRNLEPSQWLREHAALWRKSREAFYADSDTWESMLEVIPGVGTFQVLPTAKHYEFVLINPKVCDIRIWNPNHWLSAVAPKVAVGAKHATDGTGQFYISTRSRFIQFNGPEAVLEVVEKIVAFRDFLRAAQIVMDGVPERDVNVTLIETGIRHMDQLIRDLLHLSRAGRTPEDAVLVNLGELIDRVNGELEPTIQARGVLLHRPESWPNMYPQTELFQGEVGPGTF